MNAVVMKQDTLAAVSDLVERRMGLHFPPERHDALARGLERGGAELGFADPQAYAQANYEAALSIAAALPEPPLDVLALAARACADLGRLDEALAWCRKALDQDKLQAGIYHLQATVLVAKCDATAALEALKRVLYLEPHSILAHFTTANLLLRTGEPAQAMKYFRKTRTLLGALDDSAVVPDSDGMTAERLRVIVGHIQESLGGRNGTGGQAAGFGVQDGNAAASMSYPA